MEHTLRDMLTGSGIDEATIESSFRLDAVMQNWRRKIVKRELGQSALAALGLRLELPQLDILFAVDGISAPTDGSEAGEATIGAIAERLSIDPSRASRLVSEIVERGYALRLASQKDSRRTIVALSPEGVAVTDAVRTYKFLLMGTYLKSWKREEIEALTTLMQRFGEWSDSSSGSRGSDFDRQVEILAKNVAQVGCDELTA